MLPSTCRTLNSCWSGLGQLPRNTTRGEGKAWAEWGQAARRAAAAFCAAAAAGFLAPACCLGQPARRGLNLVELGARKGGGAEEGWPGSRAGLLVRSRLGCSTVVFPTTFSAPGSVPAIDSRPNRCRHQTPRGQRRRRAERLETQRGGGDCPTAQDQPGGKPPFSCVRRRPGGAAAVRESTATLASGTRTSGNVFKRQPCITFNAHSGVGFPQNVPWGVQCAPPDLGLGPASTAHGTDADAAWAGQHDDGAGGRWKTVSQKVIANHSGLEFQTAVPPVALGAWRRAVAGIRLWSSCPHSSIRWACGRDCGACGTTPRRCARIAATRE